MPMIDVYAATGTFADTKKLATELATTLMRIEGVPDIPMFRENTAAFIHEMPSAGASNVDDDTLNERTWILLTEAVDGGWGLWGHAHTNAELVTAARDQLTKLASERDS
jgi:hypothetical protein